ncbi:hypothetical protein G6F40_014774 [Rhizopus arrhizus]|nr:hypothetical protein G6F40_014774 [Rhizopus arrhizus]
MPARCATSRACRLAAIGQFPARQQPFHRAVAQGGDTVRNAGVDQRLRADDAAGAAGAVDHHKGLGIRRQLADAVDQFRPRQAVRERQREVVEFLRREAVDHDDIVAARHALVQFLDVDPGRVLLISRPARSQPSVPPASTDTSVQPRRVSLAAA